MTRTALLRCGAYCAGYSVPVRYEAFVASFVRPSAGLRGSRINKGAT